LPEQAFLRRLQSVPIRSLPGFVRGRHQLPASSGRSGEQFVHRLGAETLGEEVRSIYAEAKRVLGLRRRQLARAIAEGGGNVDAPQFRFAIELGVDPEDPKRALWQRRVVLLVGPRSLPEDFDRLFPVACDELVVPFARGPEPDFDGVVDRLEDFAERHGGDVDEDEDLGAAALSTPDGSRIALDLPAGELSLRIVGHDGCRELLIEAQRRFVDLAGPIVAALERS
jgi:hypothetical protein